MIKIEKILIGTKNKAKIDEIKSVLNSLKAYNFEILDLNNFNLPTPEEIGNNFYENAKIKALFYSNLTKIPTIADDGGLIIPYLNGEPGVKSRRWLGYEASDEELIKYALKKMEKAEGKERVAFLKTCVLFYDPINNFEIIKEEMIEGIIAREPSKRRIEGYPFRSIFIVKEFGKYYDDLTTEEQERINHRIRALKSIVEEIKKIYRL